MSHVINPKERGNSERLQATEEPTKSRSPAKRRDSWIN